MDEQRIERGQSLVEIAVVLPVLLILLFGIVEMGFGLRNYLLIVNANREAARFASRGRFSSDDIIERVVGAGGIERKGGADVPFLRTHGTYSNTGVIITCFEMGADYTIGDLLTATTFISGARRIEGGGGVRPIEEGDSRVVVDDIIQIHGPATQQINDMRATAEFARLPNSILIVETFFMHHPLGRGLVPDPWEMYARTEMRIVADRTGSSGGCPNGGEE